MIAHNHVGVTIRAIISNKGFGKSCKRTQLDKLRRWYFTGAVRIDEKNMKLHRMEEKRRSGCRPSMTASGSWTLAGRKGRLRDTVG